jgi:hypothetical protein
MDGTAISSRERRLAPQIPLAGQYGGEGQLNGIPFVPKVLALDRFTHVASRAYCFWPTFIDEAAATIFTAWRLAASARQRASVLAIRIMTGYGMFNCRRPTDEGRASVIAVAVAKRFGCPIKHPSPKNSSGPKIATIASLPRGIR